MLEHRMIVAVAVSAGLLISVVLLAVYVFDIGHSRSNSRQSTPTISRAQNRDDSGVLAAIPGWTDFASSSPNRCVKLEVTFSHDKRFAEVEPVRSTCPDPGYGGNPGVVFLRRPGKRWTEVFTGSDAPPCSLGIPKELADCYVGESTK